MNRKIRILIVEDDMIIAANLSLQLSKLGYEVTGIESRGEEALHHAVENNPDIVLMENNLKGELDGIETVRRIQQQREIGVVYLTANNDEGTFNRAKSTQPHAFISKPFHKLNLQRAIALVAVQISETLPKVSSQASNGMEVMDDRIFVRHNGKMVKILLDHILYVEADRNYCNIVTENGNYLVVSTLKSIESRLRNGNFIRVHRSFLVNISKLDTLAESYLEIRRKTIPVSRSYKELLLGRLQTI
ncbi:MAG: LytTR family transcriptional regulator DNA-binding domain-containing protein [Flavobacteriaceae bacterium]